jgi:hypothetical protein
MALDEHYRDILRNAARKAGNPALVPELERLVIAYKAERDAGPAPQMGTVYKALRDLEVVFRSR